MIRACKLLLARSLDSKDILKRLRERISLIQSTRMLLVSFIASRMSKFLRRCLECVVHALMIDEGFRKCGGNVSAFVNFMTRILAVTIRQLYNVLIILEQYNSG